MSKNTVKLSTTLDSITAGSTDLHQKKQALIKLVAKALIQIIEQKDHDSMHQLIGSFMGTQLDVVELMLEVRNQLKD
ncbi:hypothetical protein [Reinekea sp. G2M2-21]|uniref:hypothetical protein n=1 Tax=Reinekea sp. G2M2-21 TaxID=2788942 RepID=UPI0018A9A2B0|nr:hypothetical protein [Reinekea sp. G2M2-21]